MADSTGGLTPRSPLQAVLHPGEHGRSGPDGPGVILGERRDLAIASVMARNGGIEALRARLRDGLGLELPDPGRSAAGDSLSLVWAGLDRWLAVAERARGPALTERLDAALGDAAALADQSSGQCAISVEGPRLHDLMAKGPAVDLHPAAFAAGDAAATSINHTPVLIWRPGAEERLLLFVMRGFARDLWEFLTAMAREYGYRVA